MESGRRAWVTGNAEACFKGDCEERQVGRLTRGGHRFGEILLGFLFRHVADVHPYPDFTFGVHLPPPPPF